MIYEQFLAKFTDYKPITTFWQDFSIAENFGERAINDTYRLCFEQCETNYRYLTELVMVLNHKVVQHSEIMGHKRLCSIYSSLREKADTYAINTLEGEELAYYYKTLI